MQGLVESSIGEELNQIRDRLAQIHEREKINPKDSELRELKKNYAEDLSRRLAQKFANLLRAYFPDILPTADGKFHESLARASKKPKRLDVNYSNPSIGLGLGISIKTINFRDHESQRYTKNFTRVDNEWRAEASDYHERQPYAVMIGILFLPHDSVEDMKTSHSSFAQAVNVFRHRTDRPSTRTQIELFERIYIGLYNISENDFGYVRFFDVGRPPPKSGPPSKTLLLHDLLLEICQVYDRRNRVGLRWEDEPITSEPASIDALKEVQAEQEDDEEIF